MPLLQPHVESVLKSAGLSGKSLFDASVLTSDVLGNVPEGLAVRPLHIADFDKGYLDLLSQLTTVGPVTRDQFSERFLVMQRTQPSAYYVVVIEDESSQRVVGSATLVIEWKFIHSASCRGRVEDVVIDANMRGKKLGALLNRVLVALAKNIGVYKLSLECKDSLIPFYELYGFKKDVGNNFLVQRFDHKDEVDIPSSNI
ncbi:hypothetical protein WR25_14585 [Diploscapter pachys]|uniref:Glucosamine 6-phosphate N-acetyltransferase n=1 Tax=Diploscapter pachys TaxID=2018661 RepID=A0A2A2LQP7_9BILA|nr:hypothetical protein WR25_14585 [Diploscapter pachys]